MLRTLGTFSRKHCVQNEFRLFLVSVSDFNVQSVTSQRDVTDCTVQSVTLTTWWSCADDGRSSYQEQPLRGNVKCFRGGLAFKAHRLVYHSTLGWRAIKKKKKVIAPPPSRAPPAGDARGGGNLVLKHL